jgi:hypothetical protein
MLFNTGYLLTGRFSYYERKLRSMEGNSRRKLWKTCGVACPTSSDDDLESLLQQLFLRAIHADANNCRWYCMLARTLITKTTIELNGEDRSKMDLFVIAVKLDNSFSFAYRGLSRLLKRDETIELLGNTFTREQLVIEAITMSPMDGLNYTSLAQLCQPQSITLPDGRLMTPQDLYVNSIWLDPANSSAYFSLGKIRSQKKADNSPMLINGAAMPTRHLYLQAIYLNPFAPDRYTSLARIIGNGEWVTLLNGVSVQKQHLLLKAAELLPIKKALKAVRPIVANTFMPALAFPSAKGPNEEEWAYFCNGNPIECKNFIISGDIKYVNLIPCMIILLMWMR